MPGRIVLFGATGYTGRLAAHAMLRRGLSPVLAGRNGSALQSMAEELSTSGAKPSTAVADSEDPASLVALLEPGDVLVSTVGPFMRLGAPAVEAALEAGASYLDSTGEPPFIRQVFQKYGPLAVDAGSGLVTAFGYDFVPGNLAGALALRQAGVHATRVDVGYFVTGPVNRAAASGGTVASMSGMLFEHAFAWRNGALASVRTAADVRSFRFRTPDPAASEPDVRRSGISIGGSEHLGLPRAFPELRDVNVYLGWSGALSRPLQAGSALLEPLGRFPQARQFIESLTSRVAQGSSGGPDEASRARTRSVVVAEAFDQRGGRLSKVVLHGPNAYTLTGDLLAWGAERAAETPLSPGAHGPVDAFGLDTLEQGCAELGLVRT